MAFSTQAHSQARLKELMTAAPMSAEVHARIMRQRTDARRMVEEARDHARYEHDYTMAHITS